MEEKIRSLSGAEAIRMIKEILRGTHQGFNLDKNVLRKLYFENPQKVLGF